MIIAVPVKVWIPSCLAGGASVVGGPALSCSASGAEAPQTSAFTGGYLDVVSRHIDDQVELVWLSLHQFLSTQLCGFQPPEAYPADTKLEVGAQRPFEGSIRWLWAQGFASYSAEAPLSAQAFLPLRQHCSRPTAFYCFDRCY